MDFDSNSSCDSLGSIESKLNVFDSDLSEFDSVNSGVTSSGLTNINSTSVMSDRSFSSTLSSTGNLRSSYAPQSSALQQKEVRGKSGDTSTTAAGSRTNMLNDKVKNDDVKNDDVNNDKVNYYRVKSAVKKRNFINIFGRLLPNHSGRRTAPSEYRRQSSTKSRPRRSA